MVCQSPISTKKSVSFHEKVRARVSLHINDYSAEEIQATWLNAADMQRIRREMRYTVQMMKFGSSFDENEYSIRGLEHGTSEGSQSRRKNRSEAVKAVLNEQYRQVAGDSIDEQDLAKVYKVCASPCQIAAQLSALLDMRYVQFLNVEFKLLNMKLYPEISFGQTASRGSRLRRIFQRAA
jgi:hypothetical protein